MLSRKGGVKLTGGWVVLGYTLVVCLERSISHVERLRGKR